MGWLYGHAFEGRPNRHASRKPPPVVETVSGRVAQPDCHCASPFYGKISGATVRAGPAYTDRSGHAAMTTTETYDLDTGLARLGYTEFRPGQREAIETLLRQGRLLLVAPTGGGKSLVFQLPATLLPRPTLVVSPLVALMQDQVHALAARGVAVTFLSATLEADEVRRRMGAIADGVVRLVYVAPERLAFPGFRGLVREVAPSLVAIDEAHCISEWGHDFRPDYLQIGDVLAELRAPRVLACTATATPVVRDEILARLGLPADTPQVVRGFAPQA